MEIITIFAEKLYAIKYSGDKKDVYRKTIDLWTDTEYLFNFLIQQSEDISQEDIPSIISGISDDINELDELIVELSESKDKKIDELFRPLSNSVYKSLELAREKARLRKSYTRIYAIKIDSNCYVITGGALKFTQTLQEREHTYKELKNLNKVRDWLKSEGVFDRDSFYEFYYERKEEK